MVLPLVSHRGCVITIAHLRQVYSERHQETAGTGSRIMGDGSHDVFTEEVPRLLIPMIQSGPQYVIYERSFEEEEGVLISLKAQGLSQENCMKAVEGLVRDRASTIQHVSCRSP